MDEAITKAEFCARFKARMLWRLEPHTAFHDGYPIAKYADETAPSYWEEEWQRELGPEECADADISEFGDGHG